MQHVTLFVLGDRGGGRQELGEDAGIRSSGRTGAPPPPSSKRPPPPLLIHGNPSVQLHLLLSGVERDLDGLSPRTRPRRRPPAAFSCRERERGGIRRGGEWIGLEELPVSSGVSFRGPAVDGLSVKLAIGADAELAMGLEADHRLEATYGLLYYSRDI